MTVEQVAKKVTETVNEGRPVPAQPPVRVDTGGLTIEFDPEPYPEVRQAFEEYCRVADVDGDLFAFQVRAVEGDAQARVVASIRVANSTLRGEGVATDVVEASVRAFAAAYDRAA